MGTIGLALGPIRLGRIRVARTTMIQDAVQRAKLAGLTLAALALGGLWALGPTTAQEAKPAQAAAPLDVSITYLAREEQPLVPLSLAEPILKDDGLMGAR